MKKNIIKIPSYKNKLSSIQNEYYKNNIDISSLIIKTLDDK
jgi:hypothetical protein